MRSKKPARKTGSPRRGGRGKAASVRRRKPRVKGSRARKVAPALRWNPDPEDVQRSVVKLVLSLVEFIRKLMERQAIRRMEHNTLTQEEVERVGVALMKLEETVRLIAERFGLEAKDLNVDLGPVGRLH